MNRPHESEIRNIYDGVEKLNLEVILRGWNSANPNFEEAIKVVRPSVIIEAGVYLGASVDHMLTVCKRYGLAPLVFAVDLWQGPACGPIGHLPDTIIPPRSWDAPTQFQQFAFNMKKRGWDGQVIPIQNFTHYGAAMLKKWGVTCQMLYIDGDHRREGALDDMRSYWPLLEVGGIAIGDDLGERGVMQAVSQFAEEVNHPVRPESGQWVIHKMA